MKKHILKICTLIILVCTVLSMIVIFSASALPFSGDVNLDGAVTTLDARWALQVSAKMRELKGDSFVNCDIDQNGNIDIADARKILTKALSFSTLSVLTSPSKTTYYIGDKLDLRGGVLNLIYSDSSTEQVDMLPSMITTFDTSSVGKKTIDVLYCGQHVSFIVNVVEKTSNFTTNGIFNSHMVLQRDATVPVFGIASDGINVTVKFGEQTKTATSTNGKWRIDLEPMSANKEGQNLKIISSTGENFEYTDVLVGDVWLCSGQSNMYWRYEDLSVSGRKKMLKDANNPMIRSFWAEPQTAQTPQDNISRQNWVVNSKSSIDDQSAYAVAFAQGIQPTLDIPIGIATLSQGSTFISQWIEGGDYYNAMIASVMPFKFKALLWWQGENDCIKLADFKESYPISFEKLCNTYRTGFENPDMPILQTQLANFILGGDKGYGSWAEMQHLQARMINEANNLYTVCNFDIHDVDLLEIHSNEKKAAGTRAANLALEKVYKIPGIIGAAPHLEKAEKTDGGVLLTFSDLHGPFTWDKSLKTPFTASAYGDFFIPVPFSCIAPNQILLDTSRLNNVQFIRYLSSSLSDPVMFSSGLPLMGFSYEFYE